MAQIRQRLDAMKPPSFKSKGTDRFFVVFMHVERNAVVLADLRSMLQRDSAEISPLTSLPVTESGTWL